MWPFFIWEIWAMARKLIQSKSSDILWFSQERGVQSDTAIKKVLLTPWKNFLPGTPVMELQASFSNSVVPSLPHLLRATGECEE